ncbi:MAG: lipocalin family protein [Porticoccaceae bacterium]
MRYLWIAVCYFLSGCLAVPDGIEPVDNFELNRYLGDWYEIARLDHSFERGLEAVKAEYSLRDDGGIRVINSGRDSKSQVAQQAEGRAYFVEEPNLGHLKVSFFGPFFGSYVIFELDENYQYAFIAGNNRDYLWLLARTPEVSEELIDQFISRASLLGFDTSQLIFVTH